MAAEGVEVLTSYQRVAVGQFHRPWDCWVWDRARDALGYGNLKHNGKYWKAHRLAYSIHVDSNIGGLDVDHLCHNPPCFNPFHLRAVTHQMNRRNNKKQGRKGAYFHKKSGKYQAKVGTEYLGLYTEYEQAVAAAQQRKKELGYREVES